MKTIIKSLTTGFLAVMAFVTLCGTARADLVGQTAIAYPGGGTSWALDPNGNSPFYSSGNLSTSGNFTARGPATPSGSATATVLSETITITNGAGTLGLGSPLVANTNYILTGISMLISGYDSTHALSLHIFDVTSNLTGGVIASGASYNFTQNGDLLGAGNGLSWTNASLSGAEQQVYFGLQNGPNTYGDQVVLASNHTYAVEVWIPTVASSAFNWFKSSAAPQDIGGEGMGGTDASLSVARITGSALGFYGSSQHSFAIALYGAPTNGAPSVNISTNNVPLTTYVVDAFNSFGYGPTNQYVGTNNYGLDDGITNIWINWFGTAFSNLVWDATSDAQNNPNSGSLKIIALFPDAGIGGQYGPQFVVMDNYNGITPNLNGFDITGFQCDVRFDPTSATEVDTGVTNFGTVEFGSRGIDYGQHDFGSISVPVTQTNWVHVSLPVNAISDANITNIPNVYVKIYSGTRTGTTILWVDNIKLTGPSVIVVQKPPTLSIEKATPGLRIFAGSTANTYDRAEVATIDNSQSWISPSSYPVSYSFKLLSYPANINQTHIFLIPVNQSGQANMGNVSGTVNEYIDYQASNGMWLVLAPYGSGATATVEWKTNLPNANPDHMALVITNPTALGTWTLTFNNASSGTVTAPGASPAAFTIADPNVATDFANPLVAYFGVQPNSGAGIGQYEDWASITVSGVAGVNENDDFTADSSFNSSLWAINTLTPALNTCVQLVTPNTPYWVNWTLPAVNFGIGTAMNVLGNSNTPYPWMLPEYYNGYGDGNDVPGQAQQGTKTWLLMPKTCLPTTNGSQGGPLAPDAFFQLFSPALQN